MRWRMKFGAYCLAVLGVALLWVHAFQTVPPHQRILLPRMPGAQTGSIEAAPGVRGASHPTVTKQPQRHDSSAPAVRPAVGPESLPTGQRHAPPATVRTGEPKSPQPGTPAPGDTAPPDSGGATPPSSAGGPVASAPVEAPPSSPGGGGGSGSGSSGSSGTPVAAPADGGRTTAVVPPVQCPGPDNAVTNASVTVSNGVATATFQIAPGCLSISVSLATYQASSTPPALFKTVSGSFDAGGPFTLSAAVPGCLYDVEITTGTQKLASTNGGASCAPQPPPLPSPPPTPQPPTCDHGGQGDHHDSSGSPAGGTDTRPGWGWGDNNHEHTGPAGDSGHKRSP
jgi:hypothetical protein